MRGGSVGRSAADTHARRGELALLETHTRRAVVCVEERRCCTEKGRPLRTLETMTTMKEPAVTPTAESVWVSLRTFPAQISLIPARAYCLSFTSSSFTCSTVHSACTVTANSSPRTVFIVISMVAVAARLVGEVWGGGVEAGKRWDE